MEDLTCNRCVSDMTTRLNKDDISILQVLQKKPAVNRVMAIGKMEIIRGSKDLTDYKFQISISRLELAGMVGVNSSKRSNHFFITSTGIAALNKFIEQSEKDVHNVSK